MVRVIATGRLGFNWRQQAYGVDGFFTYDPPEPEPGPDDEPSDYPELPAEVVHLGRTIEEIDL